METRVQIRNFQQDDASCVEFVVLSVLQERGFLPSAKDQQELEALQSQTRLKPFLSPKTRNWALSVAPGLCESMSRHVSCLKRFRGLAIGKRLLDACTTEAIVRQYARMRLEVNSAMALSAPFYLRNGFVQAVEENPLSPSADQVYYKSLS